MKPIKKIMLAYTIALVIDLILLGCHIIQPIPFFKVMLAIFIVTVVLAIPAGNKESKEDSKELILWYDFHKDMTLREFVANPYTTQGYIKGIGAIRHVLEKEGRHC